MRILFKLPALGLKHWGLASLCLASLGLQAQTFTDYEWKEAMRPCPEIPAEFTSAKAVIVHSETFNKSSFEGEFPYIEQFAVNRQQKHIKFLHEDALKDYKRLVVPRFRGRISEFVQLKHVDIRIRRKDGQVEDVNIRSLQPMELKEDDELYSQRDEYYVLPLPKLEVGDELEQVTVIEAKFSDNGGNVTLFEDYPVLETVYTLSVPRKVKLDGRIYNGMPDPETNLTADQQVFRWRMKNLKAVPEANSTGSIYASVLPYFVYELNFDNFRAMGGVQVKNFSDLIMQYAEDFVTPRVRSKKQLEEFYNKEIFKGKPAAEISGLEKVFLLNEFLVKNMRMVSDRDLENNEKSSGIEYFLNKRKITFSNMLCVYRDFFERYKIKYYLGFGKSRFSGPLDNSFISNSQVSDYMFFVQPKDDGPYFIINGAGLFNEIPYGLMGTTCYMRDINDKKAELLSIKLGEEALSAAENKRSTRVQAKVEWDNNKIENKVTQEYGGLYATSRGSYVTANKADTLTKALDQSYVRTFKDKGKTLVKEAEIKEFQTIDPFKFKVEYTLDAEGFLKKEGDILVLDLEDWVDHQVRAAVNAENRELDYHMPFLGNDVVDYYFTFDKDVVVENADELKQAVSNDAAQYDFRITQVKPNIIRVESRLKYKKLFLEKGEVTKLKEVNKAVEKGESAKLRFKIKA